MKKVIFLVLIFVPSFYLISQDLSLIEQLEANNSLIIEIKAHKNFTDEKLKQYLNNSVRLLEDVSILKINRFQLLKQVAIIYTLKGDFSKAESFYKNAMDIMDSQASNDAEFLNAMGWNYYRMGQFDDAERVLSNAITIPEIPIEIQQKIYSNLGTVNLMKGNLIEAEKALKTADELGSLQSIDQIELYNSIDSK